MCLACPHLSISATAVLTVTPNISDCNHSRQPGSCAYGTDPLVPCRCLVGFAVLCSPPRLLYDSQLRMRPMLARPARTSWTFRDHPSLVLTMWQSGVPPKLQIHITLRMYWYYIITCSHCCQSLVCPTFAAPGCDHPCSSSYIPVADRHRNLLKLLD